MRRWLLPLLLIAGLAVGVGLYLGTRSDESDQKQTSQVSASVPAAGPETPRLIIGRADAPLTLIEYGDFQCPICKRFFEETEPRLKREYLDTGVVKLEFRVETHIGAESVAAGEAAYCAAEQKAFPAYHDELYHRQRGAESGAFSVANLERIASDLELNLTTFRSCLTEAKYKKVVEDSNTAAQVRGVSSTPTFYLGERKIVGALSYSVFRAAIEAAR